MSDSEILEGTHPWFACAVCGSISHDTVDCWHGTAPTMFNDNNKEKQ